METKYYTDQKKGNILTCPKCNISIGKAKLKNNSQSGQKAQFSCICGHTFFILKERRRSFRKTVCYKGKLINDAEEYPIIIENISSHGIRIKMLNTSMLTDGQIVEVEYFSDGSDRKVKKIAQVRKFLSPMDLGCEFISINHL